MSSQLPISPLLPPSPSWQEQNWPELEQSVFKTQKRIYRAAKAGQWAKMRAIQKTLLSSRIAKIVAVEQVRKKPLYRHILEPEKSKPLNNQQRWELVDSLKLTDRSKITKLAWLRYYGIEEKYQIRVVTPYDQALCYLVKMALEPQWFAIFEPDSYGDRLGNHRGAIAQVQNLLQQQPSYGLVVNLTPIFAGINSDLLVAKVNTFPKLNRQLKAWIKSGVIDFGVFACRPKFDVDNLRWQGVADGGILTLFLANIALHGIELHLQQLLQSLSLSPLIGCLRYGDDLLLLHEERTVLEKCKTKLQQWLNQEFQVNADCIEYDLGHTILPLEERKPGFDFIGFTVRQFPQSKLRSQPEIAAETGKFELQIQPAKETIKQHYRRLANLISHNKTVTQFDLIQKLNPKMKEWAQYFACVDSTKAFKRLDYLLWGKLRAWARRRHPKKGVNFWVNKYWHTINGKSWIFAAKDGDKYLRLYKYSSTRIKLDNPSNNHKKFYD